VRRRRRRVRQRSPSGPEEDGSRAAVERSPSLQKRGFSDVNSTPIGERRREASPSDGEEPETSQTRIWVLHKDCAKVIGKGGREMKQLELRSRTRLKVQREDEMDMETKERYIDIIGSASEQKVALELILELVTYCRDAEDEVLKDIRVTPPEKDGVPRVLQVAIEDIGRVLGRSGDTVRLMEKDSGTKIEVDKAQGKVEIFGETSKQDHAIELILAEVTFATAVDGTVLKDTRPKRSDGEESQPPLRFWVKDREAGKVIGRSGETVREVMEKTGAEIKVQKPDEMTPGTRERGVSIYGTKTQQEQALACFLEQSLTWVKAEDGSMLRETKPEPAKEASLKQKLEGPLEEESRPRRGGHRRRGRDMATKDSRAGDRNGERGRRRSDGRGGKSSAWVCATCGGDHRTKDCPHTSGVVGVGMQIGMQMGMQALGMRGMQMPAMPPIMGGPAGPLVPMMGLHGLQGALPLRRPQSSSGSWSDYSSDEYSYYGSDASRGGHHGASKQPARLKMPSNRGRASRSRSREVPARSRGKVPQHLGAAQRGGSAKSKHDNIQLADL